MKKKFKSAFVILLYHIRTNPQESDSGTKFEEGLIRFCGEKLFFKKFFPKKFLSYILILP